MCRLQTLLNMEKRGHVTYLTISVEGHELPVRSFAHQLFHALLRPWQRSPTFQCGTAYMKLTASAVSCPLSLTVQLAIAWQSQVLRSMQWSHVTVDVLEVAIHSEGDRGDITSFVLSKARRLACGPDLQAPHDMMHAVVLTWHNKSRWMQPCTHPYAGLCGGQDVAAHRVRSVSASDIPQETGCRQARRHDMIA